MANRPGHRRFGYVRKLPSGRYQASYLGPDGRRRTAPETFDRKKDADLYLSHVESLITRGEWTDPARAKIRLGDYADRWITERAGLRPRTVELYRWLLGKHIRPQLGAVALGRSVHADDPELARRAARGGCLRDDGGEVISTAARGPQHRGGRGPDHPS